MTGIYKIQSPSGRVYIGQSVDIQQRWGWYRSMKSIKSQKQLCRSFLKYGINNHIFSIVHELPKDISKEVLTNYENLYIDAYGECGISLLNIAAGRDSKFGIKLTEEQKKHLSKINTGKKLSEETLKKLKGKKAWNKGLKIGHKCNRPGRKVSEETKEKLRKANLGHKLSKESIEKRTATLKINGVKRRWSDEAKKRQSEKYLGKKKSIETILKGRETRQNKKEVLCLS